jgi:XTP/dITP diphosphohydrolase
MTSAKDNRRQIIVLASGNSGKLHELQDALAPVGMMLRNQSDLGVTEAVEDGATFVENAIKKARNACQQTGYPALADDSGLVVPALGGAPGIHSARYSGEGDSGNNLKLLAAMKGLAGEERSAHFVCILVLLQSATDPSPLIVEARWHGHIGLAPKGTRGFGYDPLFLVTDKDGLTAAELALEQKRAISHRGQAVAMLRAKLGC